MQPCPAPTGIVNTYEIKARDFNMRQIFFFIASKAQNSYIVYFH